MDRAWSPVIDESLTICPRLTKIHDHTNIKHRPSLDAATMTLPSLSALFLLLLTSTSTLAHPTQKPTCSDPLPLLIWHGLGDRYDAEGLRSTGSLASQIHPSTKVHYIRTSSSGSTDRTNTFLGNITTQLSSVCSALHSDPDLPKTSSGVIRADALGFSQGGQFLRGLVETCDGLSVRSLVTFGSQHNGIAEFQECGDWDFVCRGATALVKGNAWTEYVQSHVVPAQYFRPVNSSTGLPTAEFLEKSNFLADVNNERPVKNARYKERLAKLEKFLMVVFEGDETVVPKESGWFAEVDSVSGAVTELRDRRLYREDWLGLRMLDEKGGLVFRTAPGKHMELDDGVLRKIFGEFFGPEREEWHVENLRKGPPSWWESRTWWQKVEWLRRFGVLPNNVGQSPDQYRSSL